MARFQGEVLAEPGAMFYEPRQFMYGIDAVFVNDTVAPEILRNRVEQISSSLRVEVAATDRTSIATGATFVYSTAQQQEIELPIDYAVPASDGDVMLFSEQLTGLPVGQPIFYRIDVYDDLGNRASSERSTLEG